jgi:hypothetical protein
MTGEPADAYITDIHTFHCVAPNARNQPRIMLGTLYRRSQPTSLTIRPTQLVALGISADGGNSHSHRTGDQSRRRGFDSTPISRAPIVVVVRADRRVPTTVARAGVQRAGSPLLRTIEQRCRTARRRTRSVKQTVGAHPLR